MSPVSAGICAACKVPVNCVATMLLPVSVCVAAVKTSVWKIDPQLLLTNRLKLQGFIVSEHMEVWPEALKELGTLVGTGKLRPRESVAQGIEAAPEAFLGLLKGRNFGKQLVKLV